MGTPVSKVFKKFLGQLDDKELLLVDEDVLEDLMEEYLETATVDFNQCRKDLSFTPPEKCELRQTTEGLISHIDLSQDDRKVTFVNITNVTTDEIYEEGVHFEISRDEKGVDFIEQVEGELYFSYSLDGYFNEDLETIEIRILALAMALSYLKPKILTQDSLKQFVSDKDYTKLSGANMLLRLMGLKKNLEKELDVLQGRYAFKDFKGWN